MTGVADAVLRKLRIQAANTAGPDPVHPRCASNFKFLLDGFLARNGPLEIAAARALKDFVSAVWNKQVSWEVLGKRSPDGLAALDAERPRECRQAAGGNARGFAPSDRLAHRLHW